MKVVYVYADSPQEWNCSQWNCINPTEAINRTGTHQATAIYINEFNQNTELANKACSEADIIVVERNYFGDTLTMIQYWKVRNKTLIGIFDDAYDIMHPKNISYRFWTFGEIQVKNEEGKNVTAVIKPHPLQQFKWGIKTLKGIQVPSVNLAKDWSKYNTTYYVHNYLDANKYMGAERLYPHDEIVIGWCGSLSHHSSFTDSGVLYALKRITQKYKNVKILISGDKRVYDLLDTDRKIFHPFIPAEQWTGLLKTLDIGLAPLSGEYDKRRSWIKGLEYMALKIPWVGSNYETYSELSNFGLLTENGGKNWEYAISEMLDNYKMYKEKAETIGYEFALEQSIDKNIEPVTLALYQKLIEEPYKD